MDRAKRTIADSVLSHGAKGGPATGEDRAGTSWPATATSHVNDTTLRVIDPLVADLAERERSRQEEKLILIASESRPHPAVLEALASPFTSLYAEGYPPRRMRESSLDELADIDRQMAAHEQLGNRRFYQGTELADVVECLAERRVASCFATESCPAERIHANVQPLSGSAANLAVLEALLKPGDTMMAMALTEGGHLTHGSPYSITGKRYRAVGYGTDPRTGRLDYDAIRELAEAHRPKLLIGGFTSYPWQPDWQRFREIADGVGALLLADTAHTAGLVVGGVYPNPLGIADIVTFTTHKTLCGPRGAVVLSSDEKIARRIDRAVFPGLQGGPHVNKMAAIAVAMHLAQTESFRAMQRQIVANASHLADALVRRGLTLAYGGTDTHLLLVDLRPLGLAGKLAARVLDSAGIVCNRNVIPGDRDGADAHGIRLGTPWVTQRGMGPRDMDRIAEVVARVLSALASCASSEDDEEQVPGRGPLAAAIHRAAEEVRAIIEAPDGG
jgi:glycine hydroxymethyltransferase